MDKFHFGVFLQPESCLSFAQESQNQKHDNENPRNGSPFKPVLGASKFSSANSWNHLSGFLPR